MRAEFGQDVLCYRCGGKGTDHLRHFVKRDGARRVIACDHRCDLCSGRGLIARGLADKEREQ